MSQQLLAGIWADSAVNCLLFQRNYIIITPMNPVNTMLSVDEIRKRLSPLFHDDALRFVVLFGSVATGKIHRRSDIDLAFLYDDAADVLDLINRTVQLLGFNELDVTDLRRASPLLKFSVMSRGLLLFERSPGLFNEFYSLAFRMYEDAKKLRDARKSEIDQYLSSRGLR